KAEPALILTPPPRATDEDDGLLTASEIAQLKLDADWVVLSACNTAAGESSKPGTEALSGLARAFFYAGVRALLVSHWAVNSEATVKLITKTFDELTVDPKTGRAEALRRSMQALIEKGGTYSHPKIGHRLSLLAKALLERDLDDTKVLTPKQCWDTYLNYCTCSPRDWVRGPRRRHHVRPGSVGQQWLMSSLRCVDRFSRKPI